MKSITLITASLFATATLALADGIPVNHKTGTITAAHTVVPLSAEQVEETQTLGTFTLTPEQWREVRTKSPQCPKRFNTILPVTWSDCTCGVDGPYVIALSRDHIAVLHRGGSSISVESVRYELFKDRRVTTLRMNERGEFHLDGILVPFPTLLKAFAAPPEGAKRNESGKLLVTISEDGSVYTCSRGLDVELPMGSKPTDAVFASRIKQIAAAADNAGFRHTLYEKESNDSDLPLKPSAAAPAEAKGVYRPGGGKWMKVWNMFYAGDHEPELDDPLIAAGKDMTPVICEAVRNRDMCKRRYAIGALGFIGDKRALPTLEEILKSKDEACFFRGDALQSIYQIDKELGKKYAGEYGHEHEYLEMLEKSIEKDEKWLTEETSED